MSRWEVFKQDTAQKPHQAVGSVHAADAQHALVTAAHVFARRPQAHSLWVVRADEIYSRTAQELVGGGPTPATTEAGATQQGCTPPLAFHVFRKSSHRRSMTFVDHVGTFEAAMPAAALQLAVTATAGEGEALAWWVVPTTAVTASSPEDTASWFDPAHDKTYKQQSAYGTLPSTATRRNR